MLKKPLFKKFFSLNPKNSEAEATHHVEPLRAELLSLEQLKRHAVNLATQHKIDLNIGADKLLARLKENETVILNAYEIITCANQSAAKNQPKLSPAEGWLLDNFYIIQQQIILARRHLPRGFSQQLPRLLDGMSDGFPRIYDLALALISHMDGRIDRDNTAVLIAAYQTEVPLMLGELWAFPIMLQLALLENLRRVAFRIAHRREEQNSAVLWSDRMLLAAENEPKQLIQLLAKFADADIPLTAPFVEEFYARLQDQGAAMAFVQTWVEHQLILQGVTATQLLESASRTAATNQISIANSISSLRFIGSMDWRDFVETHSVVEHALRQDPSARYEKQDFETRDRYRHEVENIAKKMVNPQAMQALCAKSELDVAQSANHLASAAGILLGVHHREAHVGYYLFDDGLEKLQLALSHHEHFKKPFLPKFLAHYFNQHRFLLRLFAYLSSILGLTLLYTWLLLSFAPKNVFNQNILDNGWVYFLALLSALASSSIALFMVNLCVTQFVTPKALPRLDFSKGIPDECATMVVVPTLISNIADVDQLLEALEIRFLGNQTEHLYFGLLTDFYDATTETRPEDAELIAHLSAKIQALNQTYCKNNPTIFYLFHRPRTWNAVDKIWMGYERKRGKIEQFNTLLRSDFSQLNTSHEHFSQIVGDTTILNCIKFVITLDTDTQLPRDVAYQLIGNIAHPLNRPIFDEKLGKIMHGYAILQPRTSATLLSAMHSKFARLTAGEAGIDPYTREVSDVYQDVFAEGSFIGKGIYDVDAFRQAVGGRLPPNLILSHDLLESAYARSALVSDVELIEDYPASYFVDISRKHRWMRGDWQLIAWLLPLLPFKDATNQTVKKTQENPINALSRWKILDNVRRSLVSPAQFTLLMIIWLFFAETQGADQFLFWLVAILFFPSLLTFVLGLFQKPHDRLWYAHAETLGLSAKKSCQVALLTLIFLPYETAIHLDAIVQSFGRMCLTKRGLICWHLLAYSKRNQIKHLKEAVKEMWLAPAVALLILFSLTVNVVVYGNPQMHTVLFWLLTLPILLAWAFSPLVAWRISQPIIAKTKKLTLQQTKFLRVNARRTWRYFTDFVTAEEHWLPPDNVQEYPVTSIASRTSPTNIGMSLLANLAAYDFGYIQLKSLLERTQNTVTTLEILPRFHGHFFNWYDTHSLQVLNPQYISSVDSGNLLGCLLTLQAGLAELTISKTPQELIVRQHQVFQGLSDTLDLIETFLPTITDPVLRKNIQSLVEKFSAYSINNFQNISNFKTFFTSLSQALQPLMNAIDLSQEMASAQKKSELDDWITALNTQLFEAIEALEFVESEISEILTKIAPLNNRIKNLAQMRFDFLYDEATHLLSIGFDVGERRRDVSCYDLLASEARLASFLLIADGQLPQKHWFSLGRLLTSLGGELSLISWSGSMFEYLMPQLLMPSYENTLLHQTFQAVVGRQIKYGQQHQVPWGISESCYNLTDMAQVYQYRAFGLPELGFKRGLAEDLVIAPYASALALMVMPYEACENLEEMATLGFVGRYGFFEAIDYTPNRLPRGKESAVVKTFMAHHQGMSLLAFAHVLLEKPMQRRFMSVPNLKATMLLLQERIPKQGATLSPHQDEVLNASSISTENSASTIRIFRQPNTPIPEVHLLSNGRYHLMLTNSGGGFSRWHDLTVTRWREDATMDSWGAFIYLRDCETQRFWSNAFQPTLKVADVYEAIFTQGRAEYRRRDHGIETHTEISVSPEDDVEIRRVTLTNLSGKLRRIELTTYAEIVLAPQNSDLAHRAFSNLFVQSEILHHRHAIICMRRPRTTDDRVPWMFHLMATPNESFENNNDTFSYETDRAQFIGRGRTVANPMVFATKQKNERAEKDVYSDPLFAPFNQKMIDENAWPLSNSEGSVLDPIAAIRHEVSLQPDQTCTVQIISGCASSREAVLALIEKYCDRHFVERAFEMAWFQSQEVLRMLNASESDAQLFGRLASSIIYCNPMRRAENSVILRNQLGQSGLWRFGISGDLPIMLMRISDLNRLNLIKQVLQAHSYWRMHGLSVDLVIINEDFSGYRASLQDQIIGIINAGPESQLIDKPGGVFIRRLEELPEEARVLLQTVARVVLTEKSESIIDHLERRVSKDRMSERAADRFIPLLQSWSIFEQQIEALPPQKLIFDNGIGGFTEDGREYVMTLKSGQPTPAPWANVIASPHIGTVVSESGGAYTWVENAHEFRLTPWHNDPLTDASGEAFYIRDEETGVFWSPTALPACVTANKNDYRCRHGFGYSVFEHHEAGIFSEMTTYVAMDAAVKFVVIKLKNTSNRTRQISATAYWELVLGEWRHQNLMHIMTEVDAASGAIFARNPYGQACANRIVFAHCNEHTASVTGNRTEFIGRNASLTSPAAMRRKKLSSKTGAGLDPCAAIQAPMILLEGQTRTLVFILGTAQSVSEAQTLIQRFGGSAGAAQALDAVHEYWNHTLGAVQVNTPDAALNVLANGWLVYQTISSRLWGRSGTYQSGGAFGFRDQLQDTLALLHAAPWLAREQIIRCAERQFPQGDVQHWWHPPNGQGVRTHFSDDYLWLPYAVCRYVLATGDRAILDESISFIEGRMLNPHEEAYYDLPQRSNESASLYDHCVRAIKYGLKFGAHGLPLIGCGDWNDGMNLVGREGKGESVWLAWFLYENLQKFSQLAATKNDPFSEICINEAEKLRVNIEKNAWDGQWYKRAFFDDGSPLGSAENGECKIDSISQSWSILSNGGDHIRAGQAMASVSTHLVNHDARLIKLLDPPFNTSTPEPGYIKGYVPGVRENGGQYTHAAIWATMAFAIQGYHARAWELFSMLNPINHARNMAEVSVYKVEPYVMSADIYAATQHLGRGGWTWYTGAAGWMYQLSLETLLGITVENHTLRIAPRVPESWDDYKIQYRIKDTFYHINIHLIQNPALNLIAEIPLENDYSEHHIKVEIRRI